MPTYNDPTKLNVLPIESFGFTHNSVDYDFAQVEADSTYEITQVKMRGSDGDRGMYVSVTMSIYVVEASLIPTLADSTGTGTNPLWLLASADPSLITQVRLVLKGLTGQASAGDMTLTFTPGDWPGQAVATITMMLTKGEMRPKLSFQYTGFFPLAALDASATGSIFYNP